MIKNGLLTSTMPQFVHPYNQILKMFLLKSYYISFNSRFLTGQGLIPRNNEHNDDRDVEDFTLYLISPWIKMINYLCCTTFEQTTVLISKLINIFEFQQLSFLSLVVVSPLLDLLRCLAKDAGAAAEWGHTIIHVASLQQRDKISFIRLTVSFTLMSSPLCCISPWHLSWATWWRQRGAHRSEEHTECLKVTSNCDRIVFVKKVRTTNNYTASDVFLPGWPRSSAFW